MDSGHNMYPSGDAVLESYRKMLRIRRFEETLLELKQAGEIPGSVHLCIGQEAIPVGACEVLREGDYVSATYRGHGWALSWGISPADLFAEILGRDSPLSGGRGASLYFSDVPSGFLGENSIVGAGAPIAAGAAFSCLREGRGQVSVVSFGDGTMNQGVVLETLNLASMLRLPLVVVCENNGYSEMTRIEDLIGTETLLERAIGLGLAGERVDGNDISSVTRALGSAVDRARSGGGPTFVEAMTARLVGHYSGDVQHYRPAGEIERARLVEPLARVRARLEGWAAPESVAAVEQAVESEMAEALAAARACPLPDPDTALEHVYV